ncbi:rRNA accumulation- protein [Apophysomyces ossiformis]|uniref:rRNA accumulation- protein n=1 Tax=Apophysomyces ossiformis TaxID=679940 RepID=A0A8H7BQ96_9FUNG|nr:rRNA accumulation- protein [Apophysomyces ossiformis]
MAAPAPQPHPNKVAFHEGVRYIFESWTALTLAVEQDWGGVESADKREWMIDTIVDYFDKNGKKLDIEDIEDILIQIMNDEFHTMLEDDSAYLVAKHTVDLFHQCIKGNLTEVERLRTKQQSRSQTAASSRAKKEGDDSSDEGEDENDNDDEDDEDMDMDEDAGPSSRPPRGPIVDEDGWETVRRR